MPDARPELVLAPLDRVVFADELPVDPAVSRKGDIIEMWWPGGTPIMALTPPEAADLGRRLLALADQEAT